MGELDESFAQLLGRQPSDAERQELYRVRDALGLQNNDALWLVLMALQHYQHQYDQVPKAIQAAAQDALDDVKVTAEATVQAASETAKAELAQAVAMSAKEVAHDVAGKEKAQWIAGAVMVVAFCLVLVFWFAYSMAHDAGFNQGYGAGYRESKDEKAAASWANTPEGQLAYRFSQVGELKRLARCEGNGWEIQQGYCYVRTTIDNKIHGWRLPQ